MATPNYSYQKRMRDLAKQQKREAKRLKKLAKRQPADGADPAAAPAENSERAPGA